MVLVEGQITGQNTFYLAYPFYKSQVELYFTHEKYSSKAAENEKMKKHSLIEFKKTKKGNNTIK